ncbi:MAG TPA: trypsin-like serine protease, partial [Thermomicrobiales bacterium]|nr:trypsin-like serine protease [Thermomicrobiales bacterium]
MRMWRLLLAAFLLGAATAAPLARDVAAKGKKHGGVTPQIINGKQVDPGHDTFMAALLFKNKPGTAFDQQYCGGAVIAPDWVLSAAHCLKGQKASHLAVFVGQVDLNSNKGVEIDVERFVINPGYRAAHTANDAALVHLRTNVPDAVTPISLIASGDGAYDGPGTPV